MPHGDVWHHVWTSEHQALESYVLDVSGLVEAAADVLALVLMCGVACVTDEAQDIGQKLMLCDVRHLRLLSETCLCGLV